METTNEIKYYSKKISQNLEEDNYNVVDIGIYSSFMKEKDIFEKEEEKQLLII